MKAYEGFFTGTATVAGALVGLLFVAVSVAPDRLRGNNASIEHQAIASTALTALVDALFISLIGLQPNGGLDYGAVILGGLGLTSSIGLAARLWRARRSANLTRRWPYLLGFIILVYAAQVISGLVTHSEGTEANLTVAFVYTLFGTAITRSWELIGLEGGGPLDLLARRLGAREPLNPQSGEQDRQPGPPGI